MWSWKWTLTSELLSDHWLHGCPEAAEILVGISDPWNKAMVYNPCTQWFHCKSPFYSSFYLSEHLIPILNPFLFKIPIEVSIISTEL